MNPFFPATVFLINTACLLFTSGCASTPEPIPSLATVPPPPPAIEVKTVLVTETNLFNGRDLTGWREIDFGGHGEITVEKGEIQILMGAELTGIKWTNETVLPKTNYEIQLDAKKLEGNDFFCALTLPINNSFATFVVGGWGGGIVGISSLNGADASENDTTRNMYFERNRWFHIRARVTSEKLTCWIDDEKVVEVELEGRRISMRGGDIEQSVPLGITTWQTSTALKNIHLKPL